MKCPKCNEEIKDGVKFCPNCGKKIKEKNKIKNKKVIILIAVIIVLALSLITVSCILIFKSKNNSPVSNSNEESIDAVNQLDNATLAAYQEANSEDYGDNSSFERASEWYNSVYSGTQSFTMPDFVGKESTELQEYLLQNNLSSLKVEYTYDSSLYSPFPGKVLSTIPAAGTTINDIYNTKIIVLAECKWQINKVHFSDFNEDFVVNNFGKKLKIELAGHSDSIIEGVIGTDFAKSSRSGNVSLSYNPSSGSNPKEVMQSAYATSSWYTNFKSHRIAYIKKDDITHEIEKSKDTNTVHGKVFIDNKFIKDILFIHTSGSIRDTY